VTHLIVQRGMLLRYDIVVPAAWVEQSSEVIAERGVVTLKGTAPTPEIKAAAEAIARRMPGVVTVIDELEVPCEEVKSKVKPISLPLPRTG
jgi:osmotically-inducible protein OsmY